MRDIDIIKQHIESWKAQCGYCIPFDYDGLNIKLNGKPRKKIVFSDIPLSKLLKFIIFNKWLKNFT